MVDDATDNPLRKEIAELRAEIAELFEIVKMEGESTTKHIDEIYKRIALLHNYSINNISTLYDMAAPIEEKVFPQVSKVRQQLTAIVEMLEAPKTDKKP